jgi:molecular chaperone DnaK (HSP70)
MLASSPQISTKSYSWAAALALVRQVAADLFGREPNTSQNPNEAIAKGAVAQAGILSGALRQVVLLDPGGPPPPA